MNAGSRLHIKVASSHLLSLPTMKAFWSKEGSSPMGVPKGKETPKVNSTVRKKLNEDETKLSTNSARLETLSDTGRKNHGSRIAIACKHPSSQGMHCFADGVLTSPKSPIAHQKPSPQRLMVWYDHNTTNP